MIKMAGGHFARRGGCASSLRNGIWDMGDGSAGGSAAVAAAVERRTRGFTRAARLSTDFFFGLALADFDLRITHYP
jgi:hypothetical protein